jgi:hypothetical protein
MYQGSPENRPGQIRQPDPQPRRIRDVIIKPHPGRPLVKPKFRRGEGLLEKGGGRLWTRRQDQTLL